MDLRRGLVRAAAADSATRAFEQFEEGHRQLVGESPNDLPLVENRVTLAHGTVQAPVVMAAVARVAQRGERHVENFGHLLRIGAQIELPVNHSDERRHRYIGAAGRAPGKSAEHLHALRVESDLLVRFAQRRRQQILVATLEASAGKGDLSAMAREPIRAARVDHVEVTVALEQRDQHRSKSLLGARRRTPQGFDGLEIAPQAVEVFPDIGNVARPFDFTGFFQPSLPRHAILARRLIIVTWRLLRKSGAGNPANLMRTLDVPGLRGTFREAHDEAPGSKLVMRYLIG